MMCELSFSLFACFMVCTVDVLSRGKNIKKILTSILLGIIAGVIDVIPMVVQGLNWYANLSALSHWVVLGVIIPYVSWEIKPWIKGLIIAELSAIPILIIVAEKDLNSLIPIIAMSAILGSSVGYFSDKYINISAPGVPAAYTSESR